jgi:hypothetical protein
MRNRNLFFISKCYSVEKVGTGTLPCHKKEAYKTIGTITISFFTTHVITVRMMIFQPQKWQISDFKKRKVFDGEFDKEKLLISE